MTNEHCHSSRFFDGSSPSNFGLNMATFVSQSTWFDIYLLYDATVIKEHIGKYVSCGACSRQVLHWHNFQQAMLTQENLSSRGY